MKAAFADFSDAMVVRDITIDLFAGGVPTHYPKSPLRYPGGKSRAVSRILPLIPSDTTKLCSPFIGGGSIELACTAKGMEVKGFDIFSPIIDFWNCILNYPKKLAGRVANYYPLNKGLFYELQQGYNSINNRLERSAVFYVLNRASFSGTTLSGGMSPGHPRFTLNSIEKLRNFKADNLTIEQADYRQSITDNPDSFLYLDPPYMNGQKLYGMRGDTHLGFDHEDLRDILMTRDRWILSYNDSKVIRKMYKGCTILRTGWHYGMGNHKTSNEILILSNDLNIPR